MSISSIYNPSRLVPPTKTFLAGAGGFLGIPDATPNDHGFTDHGFDVTPRKLFLLMI